MQTHNTTMTCSRIQVILLVLIQSDSWMQPWGLACSTQVLLFLFCFFFAATSRHANPHPCNHHQMEKKTNKHITFLICKIEEHNLRKKTAVNKVNMNRGIYQQCIPKNFTEKVWWKHKNPGIKEHKSLQQGRLSTGSKSNAKLLKIKPSESS